MDCQARSHSKRALVSDLFSGRVRTNLPRTTGANDWSSLFKSPTSVAQKQAWRTDGVRWVRTLVAFEYHGEQHYRRTTFFHKDVRAFKQRQRDDEQKRRLCRRRKVTLLEVPYRIPHEQLQLYLANLLDLANLG